MDDQNYPVACVSNSGEGIDYSVSGFCSRLEKIRKEAREAFARDAMGSEGSLNAVQARLADATRSAIAHLDVTVTKVTPGEDVTPRGCITQHINELAVWGKPADLVSALKTIRNQDITYIALATAVGANQHSKANTVAILDAVTSEPPGTPDPLLSRPLLEKIARRTTQVLACASDRRDVSVRPADFDVAGLIEEKLSTSTGRLPDIPRGGQPPVRGLNGQG